MTGATAVEFLPDQPTTGKTAADVSSDRKKVVFQDFADKPKLYEANLDGTGFHQIPINAIASCSTPTTTRRRRRSSTSGSRAGRAGWRSVT